ncbi:MAG: hypothetical protein IKA72_05375 [Clostridia bacterium]|nr:hypothetical protein [Clostridia bacterium]
MKIDIISYTQEQFAALTETQLQEIRLVQAEKDELTAKLEKAKEKEYFRFLKSGTSRSMLYEQACERLDADYQTEVERLRNSLIFYLQYTCRGNDTSVDDAPYIVNYALSYEQRYVIVRDYYMTAYTDGAERFEAFRLDTIARNYLGEYYATLSDYLRAYAEDTEV